MEQMCDVALARPAGDPTETTTEIGDENDSTGSYEPYGGKIGFIDNGSERVAFYRPIGVDDGDGSVTLEENTSGNNTQPIWSSSYTGTRTVGRRYSMVFAIHGWGDTSDTDAAQAAARTALPVNSYIDITFTDGNARIFNIAGRIDTDFTYGRARDTNSEHVIWANIELTSVDASVPANFPSASGGMSWTLFRGQWELDADAITTAILQAGTYSGFSDSVTDNVSNIHIRY